ncbi:U5 small nuclear ribonucleoprotein 200kDA helicase [Cryptosporidium ryanae]|uniref:U5 small nuclear ribonucleoprotein 200kDA helicase n=1 Tax=Cryptosporidium ryanae TaxID=515981 RepID=UPI00351A19A5|nr:U5 small nuclear ribonucleoprotein 200kDA helicase [Cryptosporidium ryanae]
MGKNECNDVVLSVYSHIDVIFQEMIRISKKLSNSTDNDVSGSRSVEMSKNLVREFFTVLFGPIEELESGMNNFIADSIDLFGEEGTFLTSVILENMDNLSKESICLKKDYFGSGPVLNEDIFEFVNGLFDIKKPEGLASSMMNNIEIEEEIRNYNNNGSRGGPKVEYSKDINYEKVYMSPSLMPDSINNEIKSRLVPVASLNSIFRSAFGSIKNFNYVQSRVFESVYLSNRNVLVSAPTGSGKTNIALLAILRSLYYYMGMNGLERLSKESPDDNFNPESFTPPDPKKFKIVYLAPMKSLVYEISKKYRKSLRELKINVIDITSDESVTKEQIDSNHVIVTVPEKFDILTRSNSFNNYTGNNNLLDILECIIIDEIHMLGDDRGPSVEAVVSRILYNMGTTQKKIRIIGLSATLPNWEDFSSFLNVNKDDSYFFNEYFRPTPLEKTIIGVFEKQVQDNSRSIREEAHNNSKNNCDEEKVKGTRDVKNHKKFLKNKNLNSNYCYKNEDFTSVDNFKMDESTICSLSEMYNHIVFEIVSDCIRKNEQVIVFVHSRNDTLLTARYIESRLNCLRNNESHSYSISKCKSNHSTKANSDSGFIKNEIPDSSFKHYLRMLKESHNSEIRRLLEVGLGIHHAGLLLDQRKLSESLFMNGNIRVLVSTATLAWGVNLPARHVIIKGTNVYDNKKGQFKDLGVLDILQIFGRAGRPQYEKLGSAYLITTSNKVRSYLRRLMIQSPIESQLLKDSNLCNLLNSEISRGSILNVNEAFKWLQYTFLVARAKISPINYGITADELEKDKNLISYSFSLVRSSLSQLYQSRLIKYNDLKDDVSPTNYGRLASKYYIDFNTANMFRKRLEESNEVDESEFRNNKLKSDFDILEMIGEASEFSGMSVREEEVNELEELSRDPLLSAVISKNKDINLDKTSTKIAILLITYALRVDIKTPTLIMDRIYISQNGIRILRYIFELIQLMGFGISERIHRILEWSKMLEYRIFYTHSMLRHFVYHNCLNKTFYPGESHNNNNHVFRGSLKLNSVVKLEKYYSTWDLTKDLSFVELKGIVYSDASKIFDHISYVPYISFKEAFLSPITNKVGKLGVKLFPNWKWTEKWNGDKERFYIWVSNPNNGALLYSQVIQVTRNNINKVMFISELIPIPDEDIPYYLNINLVSDKWVGLEYSSEVNLRSSLEAFSAANRVKEDFLTFENPVSKDNNSLSLSYVPDVTKLLKVTPIPVSSLMNSNIENYYRKKGVYYLNPIQSQLFHVLFHTNENVFLGAPTGSGKTMIAEIAIFKIINKHLDSFLTYKAVSPSEIRIPKVVYIAPLKSLAKERFTEWKKVFMEMFQLKVVLLTGNSKHSLGELTDAFLIVTTPEKWESVTRRWFSDSRHFVREVKLVIFDEVHLIGQDQRGHVMEALICKIKYISKFISKNDKNNSIRTISLSTPLLNSKELSSWLEVGPSGYYNFSPSIRPVPCTVYISGFQEKNYCPRMSTMNKPIYNKILQYSPKKPVIIFVASRRQTRETALSLSRLCFCDGDPYKFLNNTNYNNGFDIEDYKRKIRSVNDKSLRNTLEYGIGIHHAGLVDSDREIVENLFLSGEIQIVVATSTLAWGVNFPAHLSIIKGTEYYDGRLSQYIDYPVTDVLQMIGRAGRPQFDSICTACILTLDSKKQFYKRFLYDSLPLESCYNACTLVEIMNAEVASHSVLTMIDALCLLSNSFYLRRVISNPAYYNPNIFQDENIINSSSFTNQTIVSILEKLIKEVVETLVELGCVVVSVAERECKEFVTSLNNSSSCLFPRAERRWSTLYSKSRFRLNEFSKSDFELRETEKQTNYDKSAYIELNRKLEKSKLEFKFKSEHEYKSEFGLPLCLNPTVIGQIASFFYVKCSTVSKMNDFLKKKREIKNENGNRVVSRVSWVEVLAILSLSVEFEQHPVRHNEDIICSKMLNKCPFGKLPCEQMSSPHQKVFILLQCYLLSIPVPIVDFVNDINLIIEQAPRILHSFIYLNKFGNHCSASAFNSTILVLEFLEQKLNPFVTPFYQLPGYECIKNSILNKDIDSIYEFIQKVRITKEFIIKKHLFDGLNSELFDKTINFIKGVPLFNIFAKFSEQYVNAFNMLVVSIYAFTLNTEKVFPSKWFNNQWIVLEEVNTDTIIYSDKLSKNKFKLNSLGDLPNFKAMSFETTINIKNLDYKFCKFKASIVSEKYVGVNVSCFL